MTDNPHARQPRRNWQARRRSRRMGCRCSGIMGMASDGVSVGARLDRGGTGSNPANLPEPQYCGSFCIVNPHRQGRYQFNYLSVSSREEAFGQDFPRTVAPHHPKYGIGRYRHTTHLNDEAHPPHRSSRRQEAAEEHCAPRDPPFPSSSETSSSSSCQSSRL